MFAGSDDGADERRNREAALDRTIEASFPASDPPSTIPNPDAPDASDAIDGRSAPMPQPRSREIKK
jgi:hypothetical protein